jgi:hypothetical protein
MNPVIWFSNEVSEHITPVIKDYFVEVFEHPENYLDPDSKESNSNQLIKFQLALKKIPNWTNTQIKKQIEDIKSRCPGFKKLLVALFMAYINMLSHGIRTSSKSKNFDVKLPSDEVFVHTCFVDCAHNLYEDPYVMKKSEKERDDELDKRIQKCVLKSIHKLIPTMDIIDTYIPSMSEDGCFKSTEDNGDEDDVLPETTEPAPAPVGTSTENNANVTTEQLKEEEQKTIPVAQHQQMVQRSSEEEAGEDDDELFPDAPDKISQQK